MLDISWVLSYCFSTLPAYWNHLENFENILMSQFGPRPIFMWGLDISWYFVFAFYNCFDFYLQDGWGPLIWMLWGASSTFIYKTTHSFMESLFSSQANLFTLFWKHCLLLEILFSRMEQLPAYFLAHHLRSFSSRKVFLISLMRIYFQFLWKPLSTCFYGFFKWHFALSCVN